LPPQAQKKMQQARQHRIFAGPDLGIEIFHGEERPRTNSGLNKLCLAKKAQI
jgi:hypothetical protein